MRKINVYLYDELQTDEAKGKARAWWINGEAECPAWRDEHFESMNKAIDVCSNLPQNYNLKPLIKDAEESKFTGYCGDALLSDLIKKIKRIPSIDEVKEYYSERWDQELDERLSDINYIEECILINEYEFLEDGRRF